MDDKTQLYITTARTLHQLVRDENFDDILSVLDKLTIQKGMLLKVKLAENNGMGSTSTLYATDGNKVIDYEYLKYIMVDQSSMGAWQVYLLLTLHSQLPVFWHGGYAKRKFIFEVSDYPSYPHDIPLFDNLQPIITFDNNIAHIQCCEWSNWGGLYRTNIFITFADGKFVSWEDEEPENLYEYDCGIMF